MADVRDDERYEGELRTGGLAASAMTVGASLLVVGSVVWAVSRFAELGRAGEPTASEYLAVVCGLLGAAALGALLWGAACLLRRMDDLHEVLLTRVPETAASTGQPTSDALAAQKRLLEQLVVFTRDTRDISLLNEEERAARFVLEGQAVAQQLAHDVPVMLREHNWQEAHRRVQYARTRFPTLPEWEPLAQQVEQARAKFEAHDIEGAERELEDLAALGAWDRAADVVRELQQRHPDAARVRDLARRVEEGTRRAHAEELQRLMSRAQEATSRRDWVEALRWVETVLGKFPGTPEARDLREQLPTLRANAEIHARQEMEAEIRERIKEHRYTDALRRARELIERYPDSPQAAILREQLPRLEEKSRKD